MKITAEAAANIRTMLARRGMNQADLARATKMQPPQVTRLLKAKTVTSLETVTKVADALGVTPAELFGSLPLPLFGPVPCGPPAPTLEGTIDPPEWVNVAKLFGPAEDLFLVIAKGDSMTGASIMPGDYLVIRPKSAAKLGAKVLAEVGGQVTIKVFGREGRKHVLLPCNPGHQKIVLDDEGDSVIKGVVVGVIRREKLA